MTTKLIIGDPHCNPAHNNERFDLVGRLIVDRKPDIIICMGDLADMDSLSSYDKGKKSFEGRRFTADIEHALDAQERIFAPLKKYNAQRKINKEKQYKPRRIILNGNHEDRIARAIECSPELDGLLSLDKLEYQKYWDTVVPFKQCIDVEGVLYGHFFVSGVMGNSISGFNIGRNLLDKNHQSSTVGHSHLFDEALSVKANGQRIWGLSAGCFVDYTPSYAKDSARLWWRGLIMKHNVKDGDYDLERINLETLRKIYG